MLSRSLNVALMRFLSYEIVFNMLICLFLVLSLIFLAPTPPSVVLCPAFKLSQHLVMNISDNSSVVGTKVTFSCDPGFLLNGSEFVTCIRNGVWSDEMPKCTGELVVSTSAKICPESQDLNC